MQFKFVLIFKVKIHRFLCVVQYTARGTASKRQVGSKLWKSIKQLIKITALVFLAPAIHPLIGYMEGEYGVFAQNHSKRWQESRAVLISLEKPVLPNPGQMGL